MHRRRDRVVIALACALATGGWVCEGDVANRCPGALTCDIDVANVCCPIGSGQWCDGCSSSCPGDGVQCVDEAQILDCSFNATIDAATCGNPVSTPQGVLYTLSLTGTLSGCGQESVLFVSPDGNEPDVDCGSWDMGVYGGCVSPSRDVTTTHWTFTQTVPDGTGNAGVLASFQIKRAHGSAPPVAATFVMCGGSGS